MNVVKAALLKELMNGESEAAANTENTTKKIRTRPQMRNLAQKFRSMPFLLQRVCVRIGCTVYFNFIGDNLNRLSLTLGFYQLPVHCNTTTRIEARCHAGECQGRERR